MPSNSPASRDYNHPLLGRNVHGVRFGEIIELQADELFKGDGVGVHVFEATGASRKTDRPLRPQVDRRMDDTITCTWSLTPGVYRITGIKSQHSAKIVTKMLVVEADGKGIAYDASMEAFVRSEFTTDVNRDLKKAFGLA